jgi:hypothetical protein
VFIQINIFFLKRKKRIDILMKANYGEKTPKGMERGLKKK